MKEYIERSAVMQKFADCVKRSNNSDFAQTPTWNEAVQIVEDAHAADVVEVKLLDDGTLVVTTDKYTHVNRVFVEDGKTSGSLFYAEEV